MFEGPYDDYPPNVNLDEVLPDGQTIGDLMAQARREDGVTEHEVHVMIAKAIHALRVESDAEIDRLGEKINRLECKIENVRQEMYDRL